MCSSDLLRFIHLNRPSSDISPCVHSQPRERDLRRAATTATPSCSAFAVSHCLDGLLRTELPGLLHPGTGRDSLRFRKHPRHASATVMVASPAVQDPSKTSPRQQVPRVTARLFPSWRFPHPHSPEGLMEPSAWPKDHCSRPEDLTSTEAFPLQHSPSATQPRTWFPKFRTLSNWLPESPRREDREPRDEPEDPPPRGWVMTTR